MNILPKQFIERFIGCRLGICFPKRTVVSFKEPFALVSVHKGGCVDVREFCEGGSEARYCVDAADHRQVKGSRVGPADRRQELHMIGLPRWVPSAGTKFECEMLNFRPLGNKLSVAFVIPLGAGVDV